MKCDICSKEVTRENVHLLTTTEVVSQPEYWKFYYESNERYFASLGIHSFGEFILKNFLTQSWFQMSGQESPWLVCSNCISLFEVDNTVTRNYAIKWWESKQWWRFKKTFLPPGSGAADSFLGLIVAGNCTSLALGKDYHLDDEEEDDNEIDEFDETDKDDLIEKKNYIEIDNQKDIGDDSHKKFYR